MTNTTFENLPSTSGSLLTDVIPVDQGSLTVKETLQQVLTLMLANIILHNAGNPNGVVAGNIYQFCWDTSNSVMYVCTASGNAVTTVWTIVGGFSFPLSLANGGTNKSLTASNGGIVYTDADSLEVLLATATANQILLSGSSGAPAWSTATYPSTTTINQLLYSSAANIITGLATANNSILATNSSGVPGLVGTFAKTTSAYGGGSSSNAFTATGLTSSHIVVASILSQTNTVSLIKVVPGTNILNATFSGDPGAGTTLNYIAFATSIG